MISGISRNLSGSISKTVTKNAGDKLFTFNANLNFLTLCKRPPKITPQNDQKLLIQFLLRKNSASTELHFFSIVHFSRKPFWKRINIKVKEQWCQGNEIEP